MEKLACRFCTGPLSDNLHLVCNVCKAPAWAQVLKAEHKNFQASLNRIEDRISQIETYFPDVLQGPTAAPTYYSVILVENAVKLVEKKFALMKKLRDGFPKLRSMTIMEFRNLLDEGGEICLDDYLSISDAKALQSSLNDAAGAEVAEVIVTPDIAMAATPDESAPKKDPQNDSPVVDLNRFSMLDNGE